jgi:hypothetical protein
LEDEFGCLGLAGSRLAAAMARMVWKNEMSEWERTKNRDGGRTYDKLRIDERKPEQE